MELPGGRTVFGQVWPSVSAIHLDSPLLGWSGNRYINIYHALQLGAAVSHGEDKVTLDRLMWEGQKVELLGGRTVFGQVWPSVSLLFRLVWRTGQT